MAGIAGIIKNVAKTESVRKMLETIRHRGSSFDT